MHEENLRAHTSILTGRHLGWILRGNETHVRIGSPMNRLNASKISLVCFLAAAMLLAGCHPAYGAPDEKIPDKLILLTFDDAAKSHRTFASPLLKELGFGATFLVTHHCM